MVAITANDQVNMSPGLFASHSVRACTQRNKDTLKAQTFIIQQFATTWYTEYILYVLYCPGG